MTELAAKSTANLRRYAHAETTSAFEGDAHALEQLPIAGTANELGERIETRGCHVGNRQLPDTISGRQSFASALRDARQIEAELVTTALVDPRENAPDLAWIKVKLGRHFFGQ
jgi:hypothetical protein